MNLRGRIAIITGASGAIGSVTVEALAAAGANVVLAAPTRESPQLNRIAAEAELLGVRALVVPTDVTIRGEIDRLVRTTLEAFGAIDVLVNVAGIGSHAALCDDTDEDMQRVIEVNLLGSARTMHAVLPVMKRQRRGSIINIGSVAGEAAIMGIYSASKFGLRGLTDTVRREARSSNIGVTLIEPGYLRSEMNASMGDRLPSPNIVAREVVRAARRPRRRIIVPAYYTPAIYIAKVFPGLIDVVCGDARTQRRLKQDPSAQPDPAVGPATV